MTPKWIGPCIAALGGALWCCAYAWPLIDPLKLDVVLQGDWAQHTLGWLFFRREAFGFPLGRLHDFLYPFGTTLGYMDSIPWLALVLRPFSSVLPLEFQYLGLWIVFCSALLAWAAARVAALTTQHWEQQALAGALIAMAPSLIDRIIHPALCAHFVLVLAIFLHLTPCHSKSAATRTLRAAFALLLFTTATHPYLACMVLAILIALPYRMLRLIRPAPAAAASCGMLVLVATCLKLFGYLGGDVQVGTGGFGEFSANLNTFINSSGRSRIFPELKRGYLQYEGYSYLGAGCLFMAALAVSSLFHKRTRSRIAGFPWRRALWPLIAAVGLAIFAMATPWKWGETDVLNIRFYERIAWFTSLFRSSGRMVWPLAYLLDLTVVTAVLRALRMQRWAASALLVAAVALQGYDLGPSQTSWIGARNNKNRYAAHAWSLTDPSFKHLVLYPAEIAGACESPGGYRADEVNSLAYLAYRRGWTFNSGYAARVPNGASAYCGQLERQVRASQLREDTIYVVRRDQKLFRTSGATCGHLSRSYVCVLRSDHPFATYLAEHKR